MRRVMLMVTGAATFVVVHLVVVATWQTTMRGEATFAPWFLNSGRAIVWMLAAFAVAALGASASDDRRTATAMFDVAAWIAIGGAIPMIIVLFTLRGGPGTIFPIVIVGGALFLLAGALVGAAAGWAAKWLSAHRRR